MRLHTLLKAKLHHARITYSNPDYVGSIEIDGDLMKEAGILPGELVHIWAVDHTARIETYAFPGPRGVIGLNGGAAYHFKTHDRVIIAAFVLTDEELNDPKLLLLDDDNALVRHLEPFNALG